MLINLVKIFAPTAMAFFLGLALTPIATHYFYKHKLWKKHSRKDHTSLDFKRIHNEAGELNTPRIGGVVIWVSVVVSTLIFYLGSVLLPAESTAKMNFLSRSQTLIPFFTLILGAIFGLWDDLVQIFGNGTFARDDKSWRKWKILLISLIAFLIGSWFYFKLGLVSINIPFNGDLYLGALMIPFFVLVTLAVWSGSVIDGIDGLAGGVLAAIFASYTAVAYANNQMDMAAFCGVITGAILAFLWFNIPPARFYMGETGMMALTITLSTIAFLTDSVLLLPVLAFPLAATSLSVILQLASKKFRRKKLFLLSPLHHHFEALGWPSYKVTMRFWILSVIFSIIGIILAVIS